MHGKLVSGRDTLGDVDGQVASTEGTAERQVNSGRG